jgi:LmbE family N-acetylglucosaminyl deacetylase
MRRILLGTLLLLASANPSFSQERGAAALGELLDGLGVSARVLMIGAHPDDEDTQFLTWLARGRHVETAYLSLTRGDGGQNLIGNELGEALGVIRTEELLAARRVDGGHQFFTRAYDFGFSKSAAETFRHWPRDSILRDVVTVIRAFRPQVVVAVFSGTPRDGHGHHQVSGILAREAYDAAGDTVRFPVMINPWKLPPWTPLKFYRASRFSPESATLGMNVGEYSPLLGRSYGEIAGESRSQHKSQGFGVLQRKGVLIDYVRREASRVPAPVDAKQERSIFDGIDTTWVQFLAQAKSRELRAALEELPRAIARAQAAQYFRDPTSVIAPLTDVGALIFGSGLRNRARILADGSAKPVPISDELGAAYATAQQRVSRALALATGVTAEAIAERELLDGGDSVRVTFTVYNRGRVRVRILPEHFSSCQRGEPLPNGGVKYSPESPYQMWESESVVIAPDSSRVWKGWVCAGERAVTEPWWLERPRRGDMFQLASTRAPEDEINAGMRLGARAELTDTSHIAGMFDVEAPIVFRFADPVRGDVGRPLAVVPAIAITLDRTTEYMPAGAEVERPLRVQLRLAATAPRMVKVSLKLPPGLTADSASRTVTLARYGDMQTLTFALRGKLPAGRHTISATAESEGKHYSAGYALIDYPHIRPQRLYREAAMTIQAVDVKLPPGTLVAYIRGVGDNVAPMLDQLGIAVTTLDPAALPTTDLSRYSAVVVGPRAYEASDALVANNARLLDYARNGGTVIAQYGQYEMTQPGIMPYPISLGRPADRVTEENAQVRFLDPASPLLTYPNALGARDFDGWVQERALYMPRAFDPSYHAVLSMNDPGEEPNAGALLVAPYGKGVYVYTTLSFFRQLPAGVPGPARLFVNVLAAGQQRGAQRTATPDAGSPR